MCVDLDHVTNRNKNKAMAWNDALRCLFAFIKATSIFTRHVDCPCWSRWSPTHPHTHTYLLVDSLLSNESCPDGVRRHKLLAALFTCLSFDKTNSHRERSIFITRNLQLDSSHFFHRTRGRKCKFKWTVERRAFLTKTDHLIELSEKVSSDDNGWPSFYSDKNS